MRRIGAAVVALTIAIAIAACGGSNNTTTGATGASSSNGATVATAKVPGVGTVLVANGMALYTPNGERAGAVRCTGGCVAIWKPLTTSAQAPRAASGVGPITVIARPDGTKQLAVAGHPLYTFAQDGSGQVTGNGATDMFGGQQFTWHVVLAGGNAASGSAKSSGEGSGGSTSGSEKGGGIY